MVFIWSHIWNMITQPQAEQIQSQAEQIQSQTEQIQSQEEQIQPQVEHELESNNSNKIINEFISDLIESQTCIIDFDMEFFDLEKWKSQLRHEINELDWYFLFKDAIEEYKITINTETDDDDDDDMIYSIIFQVMDSIGHICIGGLQKFEFDWRDNNTNENIISILLCIETLVEKQYTIYITKIITTTIITT